MTRTHSFPLLVLALTALLLGACGTDEKKALFPVTPVFAGYRNGAIVLYDKATRSVFTYQNRAFVLVRQSSATLLLENDSLSLLTDKRDTSHTLTVAWHDGRNKRIDYPEAISRAIVSTGYLWISSSSGKLWKTSLSTGDREEIKIKGRLCAAIRDTLYFTSTAIDTTHKNGKIALNWFTANLKTGNQVISNTKGTSLIPSLNGTYWSDDTPNGDSLMIYSAPLSRLKFRAKLPESFNFVVEYPNNTLQELVSYVPGSEQLNLIWFEKKAFYHRAFQIPPMR